MGFVQTVSAQILHHYKIYYIKDDNRENEKGNLVTDCLPQFINFLQVFSRVLPFLDWQGASAMFLGQTQMLL